MWHNGATEPLLSTLGFEPVAFEIPGSALADFGLDPAARLGLEVAARYRGFHVFRVTLRDGLDPDAIRRTAAALYRHNPARRALLIFEAPGDPRLVVAGWGLGPGPFRLHKLWIDPLAPRRSELDILARLAVGDAATPTDLALAHARALDRERVTRGFFAEFRRQRAELAAALTGVPASAAQDRLDIALILLSRLLFLYFIQRKGWLAGDTAYLRHLYEAAMSEGVPFFRRRLKPLFFGALNRPQQQRSKLARELGELPYLNGGLFERDALERKHSRLGVPDEHFAAIFDDLLDRYQFTLREDQPADQDVAVDPEMLGKVFEGLMAAPVRGATGTFFTPRAVVDRLVDGVLSAYLARSIGMEPRLIEELLAGGRPELAPSARERLIAHIRGIRVLDPAVGSGAFLLAALQRLETLHDALEGRPADAFARFERRRRIVQRSLHGVDISGAAVRLCELRLWLALIVDLEVECVADVPPLPNLDINVRQGDTLFDPIDFLIQLADLDHGRLATRWRKQIGALATRRDRYFHATGDRKRCAQRTLRKAERELAIRFLAELAEQIDSRRRELKLAARGRDLFGERAGLTRGQRRQAAWLTRRRRELSRLLRRIREAEELPFFSFPIHFADPGRPATAFHVVVGNPPWVRQHHWAKLSRARLSQRFRSLREAGWRAGARLAGAGRGFGAQLDLSALFLERSLELLAEDGALGFLLPAKLARSLSAGSFRRQLLAATRILRLEDWSLTTSPLFEATTYPLSLLLTRARPEPDHEVSVLIHDRHAERLDFRLPQSQLPLLADDREAPWALAPRDVRAVFDHMRAAGPPLGAHPGRRPCRGVFTGANDLFVGELLEAAPGNSHVTVRLAGSEVEIERERLRPVLRGEDLGPWRFSTARVLVWTHEDSGDVLPKLPAATAGYLRRHRRFLEQRVDVKPGQPYWILFRARPEKWARRVVWRDIAPAPGAVVVPRRVSFPGGSTPLVSLNTVYQIAAASDEDAHLLAAVLNSTVARAYLKAIAERASGGYFRFLGWTVALLPFPTDPDAAATGSLVKLSRRAHANARLARDGRRRLDELVARLYRLEAHELETLRAFDARLSNPGGDE
jgi:hypothetical protein